ncbi:hypothetical protein ACFYY1_39960 [Streptomyces sp. NPDC001890]
MLNDLKGALVALEAHRPGSLRRARQRAALGQGLPDREREMRTTYR